MFPYKKNETPAQLFRRIAKSIVYFRKRDFILKYPLRDDNGNKSWITMTKRSEIDVEVLYASAKNMVDFVKIEEGKFF